MRVSFRSFCWEGAFELRNSHSFFAVPLWMMAAQPRHLALDVMGPWPALWRTHGEQSAEQIISATHPTYHDVEIRPDTIGTAACRTLITAARGGQLRRVSFRTCPSILDRVFAIRELIPCWVAVEKWDYEYEKWWLVDPTESIIGAPKRWAVAAASLRTALSHVSLTLSTGRIGGRRISRLLALEDVKNLRANLMVTEHRMLSLTTSFYPEEPILLYLEWLEENEELAKKVTQAWNEVVGRKEADVVKCLCKQCSAELPPWNLGGDDD